MNSNKTPFHLGQSAELKVCVGEEHLASSIGNPGVDVLSTPTLVHLFEHTATRALEPDLPDGTMTVGVSVSIKHLAATPLGREVTIRATIRMFDGRRIIYTVEAHDEAGLVSEGTHERVWLNAEPFVENLQRRFDDIS